MIFRTARKSKLFLEKMRPNIAQKKPEPVAFRFLFYYVCMIYLSNLPDKEDSLLIKATSANPPLPNGKDAYGIWGKLKRYSLIIRILYAGIKQLSLTRLSVIIKTVPIYRKRESKKHFQSTEQPIPGTKAMGIHSAPLCL